MRKLLIVEYDEPFRNALVELLRRKFQITVCADGDTAVELIRTLQPDGVILNLMLPMKDGLCVLEETMDCRPPVVLCLCDFQNPYINQSIRDLDVTYSLRKPCYPRVVAGHIQRLMDHTPDPRQADAQTLAAQLLLEFHFNPKNDGFRFLKIGIPMFAQDPQQRVCKELYVTIAELCGAGNWNQVERSIRSAIEAAWKAESPLWQEYFPGITAAPTGKTFISRIALMLNDL